MSGKGGSSLGTLLFSVPLAAIPLMAIFGIPQFAPLVASPEQTGGYDRSLDEQHPEDRSYTRRAADVLRSRGFETRLGRDETRSEVADREFDQHHDGSHGEFADRQERRSDVPASRQPTDERDEAPRSYPADDDAPPYRNDERQPARPSAALADQQLPPDAPATKPPATALNWQSAAQRFQDLGITSYHLEPGAEFGSFLFVCSFCPEASPNVTMRFEAEASEPLDAVDDVLAQIDRWQQQQHSIDYSR